MMAPAKQGGRLWPLISASVAVSLAVALGLVIMVRARNLPLPFDREWMDEVIENRAIWFDVPALLMNWLGGGWFGTYALPLGTVLLLCLFRRFWAALYYAAAAVLSVSLVQSLKGAFDRPRPEDILIATDIGSFPSGHVANAATIAVALAIILGRTWVWVAGVVYIVLMALSRTYLGAHWLSDTIGGALLGAGMAVIVWAPLSERLHLEQRDKAR